MSYEEECRSAIKKQGLKNFRPYNPECEFCGDSYNLYTDNLWIVCKGCLDEIMANPDPLEDDDE